MLVSGSPSTEARRPRGYADMRKTSIYGGTTEVQKGIIARHALGL